MPKLDLPKSLRKNIPDLHHCLGFKKASVTLIDYKSDSIRTGKTNPLEKKYIINIGKSSALLEPKSTEHAVYCNKSKNWEPIILLSSMFKIETKEIVK